MRVSPVLAINVISALGFFILSLISLVIPLLLLEIGASIVEIGFANALRSAVILLLTLPLGFLSDRLGRRRVVLLGLGIMTSSMLLFTLSRSYFFITFAFAINGIGWAAFEPAVSASVGDEADPSHIGRSYGTFATSVQAGLSSGPAVGGVLITLFGYEMTFIIVTVAAIAAIISWAVIMRSTVERRRPAPQERPAFLSSLLRLRRNTLVITGWCCVASSFILIATFETFFPVYAKQSGLAPLVIGIVLSSRFIVGMVGRIPIGVLLDRSEEKARLMALGLAGTGATIAMIPFFTDPLVLILIMGAMAIVQAIQNIGSTIVVAQGAPAIERGIAMGMSSALRQASFTLSPALLGIVFESMGFRTGFLLVIPLAIGGAIIVYFVGRDGRAPDITTKHHLEFK